MSLRPRPGVDAPPYRVPRARAPVDLALDANEGAVPDLGWLSTLELSEVRRYPSASSLEAELAARHGVDPAQVIVTAGADDALDRACRAVLGPGDEAILPVPGFSVMSRWIGLTGASQVDVPWPDGPYPTDAVIAAITSSTRMIIVTSPNNPTGAVATADDLARLAEAAPDALLLVDLAYVEFADEDLTDPALRLPSALVMRTLSKAWGLAGLRVGYALGSERIIGWLRTAGLPYPVSGPSLAMAREALRHPEVLADFVARVRAERPVLVDTLAAVGLRPQDSQANFVLARTDRPLWWRDGLAGMGIGIRAFPGVERLDDAIRMACPGSEEDLERVVRALRLVARPERILVEEGVEGFEGEACRAGGLAAALDGRRTWIIARSTATVEAARTYGVLALGFGEAPLVEAGAARVLSGPQDLARLLAGEEDA